MKPGFVSLLIALALSAVLVAFEGFPRVTTVEPDSGKVGDAVSAKGENLDKASIGDLYLTDGKNDTKVQIDEVRYRDQVQGSRQYESGPLPSIGADRQQSVDDRAAGGLYRGVSATSRRTPCR
jgi:hypothetical protein